MKKAIYIFSSLLLLFIAHTPVANAEPLPQGKGALRVMTYNVYQGTNFTTVLAATDVTSFLLGVGSEVSLVRSTNPPARMQALAKQIAAAAPMLVGLQEVSTWSTGPFTGTCGALTVEFDMLQELLDALAAEGAHYEVAVQAPELTFPAFPGLIPPSTFFCVAFSNYDVILARTDINKKQFQWNNPQVGQYTAKLSFPVPGGGPGLPVPRAWGSVDVNFLNKPFRFITSHLESGDSPAIVAVRKLQGGELRNGPANTLLPLIIAFDSNADPALPDPTYTDFIAAGYNDVALQVARKDPQFTCCQSPTVDNAVSELSQRIDLILTVGNFIAQNIVLYGATTDSKTPGGLWPSDHAGVAGQLQIPGTEIALKQGTGQ